MNKNQTIRKFRIVQKEGDRTVERKIDFYNPDVIISVGYRVKSQRGTQFRIWTTQILKDHILKGYSINEKRLQEQNVRLPELQKTVKLLQRVMEGRELARDEATGLLQVITDYSYALSLLDQYDSRQLKIRHNTKRMPFILDILSGAESYRQAWGAVEGKRTTRCIIRTGKGSIVQRLPRRNFNTYLHHISKIVKGGNRNRGYIEFFKSKGESLERRARAVHQHIS